MKIRPFFKFVFIFCQILFGTLWAQVTIIPPVIGNDCGQFQILELNLINNSGNELNATISYEIFYGQNSADKLETSGKTKNFKIPITGIIISASNIQTVLMPIKSVVNPSQAFGDFLIKNAKFPDGAYRICVTVRDELTQNQIGYICYDFKIENLTSIFLVSPSNNDIVSNDFQLFSWTALTQLPNPEYELVLIEVLNGQSLLQAAKSNREFFSQRSNTNILQLSFASRKMTDKSTYLWYVKIMKNNIEITRSELWSFQFIDNSNSTQSTLNNVILFDPIVELKADVVTAPELRFPKLNSAIRMADIDTVEFIWKHDRNNIKGSIIYEFALYEKFESKDKDDSLIYVTKKKEQVKLVLPKSLKLKEGSRYKWKVTAAGNSKLKPCKNGCSSSSYSFEIGHSPQTLQYHRASASNNTDVIEVKDQLNFTCCIEIIHHDGISLTVYSQNRDEVLALDSINVKDTNESLTKMSANKYTLLLNNLKQGEPYLLRVGRNPNYEYIKFQIPKK